MTTDARALIDAADQALSKTNWLRAILDEVERRAAARPPWMMSEYAQAEIAKLRDRRNR